MGFPPIPGKEAAGWPLLPDYGHYMGLNLGVFWRDLQLKGLFSTRTEKKRFAGLFSGGSRDRYPAVLS